MKKEDCSINIIIDIIHRFYEIEAQIKSTQYAVAQIRKEQNKILDYLKRLEALTTYRWTL